MRVVFVNRFFYPDHSATSQMLTDLAFEIAQGRDAEVAVVTGRQQYDEPNAALPAREEIRGVSVRRAWSTRFGRAWLPGRAIDYFTFYLASAWELWRLVKRGDVVVAKTDPPLISVICGVVTRLKRARQVNWLQDVFPEVAQALRVPGMSGPIGHLLYALRNWSLNGASANVVLGARMRSRVMTVLGTEDQLQVIPNWADGGKVYPVDRSNNTLAKLWHLDGKFVVGYSGNLGRAHDFETIIGAAERLRDDDEIVFLFIGGGNYLERLRKATIERGLNCLFMPYQPRERLAESLSVADVHLVTLREELEGLIVPSKYYGIAAVGRPAIFIGDLDGEIARVLVQGECGAAIRTADVDSLCQLIHRLKQDDGWRRELGNNAREVFLENFDKRVVTPKWAELLAKVAQ